MSGNKKKDSGASLARRTAAGGAVAALGLTVMYLGAVLDILDISAAAFASILLIAVISEYGRRDALCVFAVTSVLSWLLLPNRMPALMYTVFLGYYPIIKPTFDRMKRVIGWVAKLAVLNAAVTAAYFAAHLLLAPEADDTALMWLWYPLVNIAFVLYDIALGQMTRLWRIKLRRYFGKSK